MSAGQVSYKDNCCGEGLTIDYIIIILFQVLWIHKQRQSVLSNKGRIIKQCSAQACPSSMFYVHAKSGYRPLNTVVQFKIKKLDKQSENCHDYKY